MVVLQRLGAQGEYRRGLAGGFPLGQLQGDLQHAMGEVLDGCGVPGAHGFTGGGELRARPCGSGLRVEPLEGLKRAPQLCTRPHPAAVVPQALATNQARARLLEGVGSARMQFHDTVKQAADSLGASATIAGARTARTDSTVDPGLRSDGERRPQRVALRLRDVLQQCHSPRCQEPRLPGARPTSGRLKCSLLHLSSKTVSLQQ